MKPWATDANLDIMFDPMDRDTWKLTSLPGLVEKAKFDWFLDAAFTNYLFPMVDAGEPKSQFVLAVCKQFLETWEEESAETDLDESSIEAMSRALFCWRSAQTLIEMRFPAITPTP